MSDHPPHTRLGRLLQDLFSQEELRLFLWNLPDGRELLAELILDGSSLARFAHETCEALQRRGSLNGDFFQHLSNARPRRAAEIQRIRDLFIVDEPTRIYRRVATPKGTRKPFFFPPTIYEEFCHIIRARSPVVVLGPHRSGKTSMITAALGGAMIYFNARSGLKFEDLAAAAKPGVCLVIDDFHKAQADPWHSIARDALPRDTGLVLCARWQGQGDTFLPKIPRIWLGRQPDAQIREAARHLARIYALDYNMDEIIGQACGSVALLIEFVASADLQHARDALKARVSQRFTLRLLREISRQLSPNKERIVDSLRSACVDGQIPGRLPKWLEKFLCETLADLHRAEGDAVEICDSEFLSYLRTVDWNELIDQLTVLGGFDRGLLGPAFYT